MNVPHLILMVFAFVFFVCAAVNVPSPPRLNFIGAGLACWVLTLLI
jgi:hypothetical protein